MSDCGQCQDGFVPVKTFPTIYGGRTEIEKQYACVCAEGRKRLERTRGIEDVLSAEELDERWPKGFTRIADNSVIEAFTRANVLPAMHGWSLESYAKYFSGMKILDELMRRSEAWLTLPNPERSDWVLYGPNGTGKTGFAVALLRGVLDKGQTIQFWTVSHLALVWRASYDKESTVNREFQLMEAIKEPHVLVLDEFGGTSTTDFVESTITTIVDARQKNLRPTILTLNIAEADATDRKKMGQRVTTVMGPTLVDRLRERAQWMGLVGGSRRKAWTP